MGEAAQNAHNTHDDGCAEESVFAPGILQHITRCVQTAEEVQQRVQGQRTDSAAETAAQVSCHIDGPTVRIPVGGKAAHGVIGDGSEGVEQFKQEIDGDGDGELQRIGYIKGGEHQHHGDGPGDGAPQGEGTAFFTVFELVVHGPVANHGIVYCIPDDADGGDDTGMGDLDAHDIG